MNRAITRIFSSTSRILPRIYASTKPSGGSTTAATGHHGSEDAPHHHDDHGHGHGHHHHEPQLRKTQEWRHHSGMQSKYENQSEDPNISFTQEQAHSFDYRPAYGQVSLAVPYRTHAQLYEMWYYHAALIFSIWFWWYVAWRFYKEPGWFFGHAHYPDMSKYTDEELGIPPDDLD